MKRFAITVLLLACAFAAHARKNHTDITPSGEYLFAQKDSCSLFLSVYDPEEGAATTPDGARKPSVLFVFGGGFATGERNDEGYLPWFKMLTENGYRVITIDYRLKLKGRSGLGVKDVSLFHEAVETGVEDLFSATSFIIENAEALRVDPAAIVVSGSSAGAMISLQAAWHLSNRDACTANLPEGFRYAGVMTFSGAILSLNGKVKYAAEPSPTLMFHGTQDKIVVYKGIRLFKIHYEGSSNLAVIFRKNGCNYNIYRFDGNRHEIASAFLKTFPEQLRFLETNVSKGEKRIVDAVVHDPSIKVWNVNSTRELYGKN